MKNSKRLLQSISARAGRFILLLPLLAASQDAPLTIRTETRAVQVDVAVRDSHGNPVRGLTKDDFTLLDNGKPRAIAFFSTDAGEPAPDSAPSATPPSSLSAVASPTSATPHVFSNTAPSNAPQERVTVILLDASSPTLDETTHETGSGLLIQARKGAADAMAKLPLNERIAIYQISPSGLKIVQNFTTDRDLLRKSIKTWTVPVDWKRNCGHMDSPDQFGPGMHRSTASPPDNIPDALDFGCGVIVQNAIRMGIISTLDSLRILAEKMAGLPGRKNLIWVTPGFPMGPILSTAGFPLDDMLNRSIAQLNDANVELNAIDVRGTSAGGIDEQSRVMRMVTEPTGGKAYLTRNDIGAAILEVDQAERTDYTLGFYLADNERDGKFHKLELRVDRSGLSLNYRKGYLAGDLQLNGKPTADGPEKEALETELLDPVDANAIGISGTAYVTPGHPNPTFHLKLSLDGRGLTLRPQGNGTAFKVSRIVAEMDARGTTLVQAQDSKDFSVPTKSLDVIHRLGIHWEQTLPLMMGAETVRVIVRDQATGQAGTLTVRVADAH